jgi:hypothetical protein
MQEVPAAPAEPQRCERMKQQTPDAAAGRHVPAVAGHGA